MGVFVIKRALSVKGGSIHMVDANIFRDSANVLKTDDALTVASTLTASDAFTMTAGIANMSGGTSLLIPYHTVSPNVSTNGHLTLLQKGNRSYLLYRAGGTPCYITLPQVTEGTALFTIAGTP